MTQILCLFGRLGEVSLPGDPTTWRYAGAGIDEVFASASNQDIHLTLESKLGEDLDPTANAPTALDLHTALTKLTGNTTTRGPIDRIGVLFADTYFGRKKMLGVMFDRGFDAPDDHNQTFGQVPREGCAVFVGAISKLWQNDAKRVEAELHFTTVHEMGHVFNLEHIDEPLDPPNFMRTSDGISPYGPEYYQFVQRHRGYLQQCSSKDCIHPGGSRYGDRQALAASFDPAQVGNQIPSRAPRALTLSIALTQTSFWYCEPVELEVTIALPDSAPRASRFLDRLDPGYGEFSIWIEEPTGARRRYRSTKFFCAQPEYRTLTPGQEFRRDLSIFGQSGGYTFQRSGEHRIWVTFQISRRQILHSKKISFEVRNPQEGRSEFSQLEPLMRRRARLLYYRAAHDLAAARADIQAIARIVPRSASAACSHYALGRAHARRALRSKPRAAREHRLLAAKHLEIAGSSSQLGPHSAAVAASWHKKMLATPNPSLSTQPNYMHA